MREWALLQILQLYRASDWPRPASLQTNCEANLNDLVSEESIICVRTVEKDKKKMIMTMTIVMMMMMKIKKKNNKY